MFGPNPDSESTRISEDLSDWDAFGTTRPPQSWPDRLTPLTSELPRGELVTMRPFRPNTRRRTILVTGFDAFPGAPRNPTEMIVGRLRFYRPRFERLGIDVHCVVLPVRFTELEGRLGTLARELRPDAILHLGVAGRRRRLSVEMRAINRAGPLHPDASGRCPAQVLLPCAAQSMRATFPGLRILATLRIRHRRRALDRCGRLRL